MPNFLYQTTNSDDAFEAYKQYVSLRSHFTSKHYDYQKYNGRIKATKASFLKRSDVYWFHKLALHPDKEAFLVANFAYGEGDWIGNMVQNTTSELNYKQFCRVRDSLTYQFKLDLEKMLPKFDDNFAVEGGQHPPLLKMLLRKQINLETFVILEDLCSFSRKWNRRIEDTVIWPVIHMKVTKFKPFVMYDKEKMKKIVVDFFSGSK